MTRTTSKTLALAMALFALVGCGKPTFTDDRDGKTYATTTIGKQVWMAQNLDYDMDGGYCYDDDPANCAKYGRLYTRDAAMKACPEGWHLPTSEEWDELGKAIGEDGGTKLKSGKWNGTDEFGFAALPAGFRRNSGSSDRMGAVTFFLSATEGLVGGVASGLSYMLHSELATLNWVSIPNSEEDEAGSVRCVKDASESGGSRESEGADRRGPTFTDDRDGKTYATTMIGKQVWMAQNLDYDMDGGYCYKDDSVNCGKYGRLYTWPAAMEACPTGGHLPTHVEWNELQNALGENDGTKLKTASWGGTNEVGFHALPAGGRGSNGIFGGVGSYANFWTATEGRRGYAIARGLESDDTMLGGFGSGKYNAFSVRCVKD